MGTTRAAEGLRGRQEWAFFTSLHRADRGLAVAWWTLLAVRGALPALMAVAMGVLTGAVEDGASLAGPLTAFGVVFVAFQVLFPIHRSVSSDLGDRLAAWLFDELTAACLEPPGIGHLEDPELAADLQVAHDFDAGVSGPPLRLSLDFIADGLVLFVGGLASAAVLFGFAWWAPLLVAGGWLSTHWLLRESGVWKDRNTDEVRAAQRDAEYAYRLAVDPPGAKELRLFGLGDWVLDRFVDRRRTLHRLQYEATRLREKSVASSVVVVLAANLVVFWQLGEAAIAGTIALGALVAYVQAAVSASSIAFGGLNWALDGAAAPVAAVLRLREAMAPRGALPAGTVDATGRPAVGITLRDLAFAYPSTDELVLDGVDLEIPAGTSLAIVGQNGAGKTTLAKLLCRLYDPTRGVIEVDGTPLPELELTSWRRRVTAVFQDYLRMEWTLRENVAPQGATDEEVRAALEAAEAADLADLDTPLAKGYRGGTDLSGGQWQRVALARAVCAVRQGAGLVLLDEPTAQLDVRGEAEIFERILAETRNVTTILVSHRFSTVRHADRICVVEGGRVIELGSHDELIALDGRYRTMFDLQAQRFASGEPEPGEEELVFDAL